MLFVDELDDCLSEIPAFNYWESPVENKADLVLVATASDEVLESLCDTFA
jgi:hypothetical protein